MSRESNQLFLTIVHNWLKLQCNIPYCSVVMRVQIIARLMTAIFAILMLQVSHVL